LSEILPCVEVEPSGEVEGAVVWLHGLGASGHDFEDVVPLLELPAVRFVFPHAPSRPVTINRGLIMPAWYDVAISGGPRGGENASHVRDAARRVEALLEREQERGVPSSRIALAGFSQGGALALFVGVRYTKALLGIVSLSARELLPETREAEASPANRKTPVLIAHGLSDPVVSCDLGRRAHEALSGEGRPVEWHEFPMAHEVCLEEIGVIRDWLKARFHGRGGRSAPSPGA
jgi:phospholipase/carboxylesterase